MTDTMSYTRDYGLIRSELSDEFRQVVTWDLQHPPETGGASVRFRLVYQGPLASGSNDSHSRQKNQIRRKFHQQLSKLWEQHTGLRELSAPDPNGSRHKKEPQLILPNKNGDTYRFLYLIGQGHGISCSLDILFLRRDLPGGIFKRDGGDLDNRLKILFDALRMPRNNSEVPVGAPMPDEDPFFCVLEDDKFIDRVNVTTDRLLAPTNASINEQINDVLLVIEVQTIIFDTLKADWWVTTDR